LCSVFHYKLSAVSYKLFLYTLLFCPNHRARNFAIVSSMKQQNTFGHMHAEYSAARRGYPSEVYEYLLKLIRTDRPRTLDVGCGTGISTRELQQHGFQVAGADKETEMINAAREQSSEIEYVVAPADTLPFDSESFNLVTAFTAFHWFNDEKSLTEIRRVLKTGGGFFVALKGNREDEESVTFRAGYRTIMKRYGGEKHDKTQEHFRTDIVKSLFSDIREKSFYVDEKYTVDNALTLVRSLSVWNLISEENKPKLLEELQSFYNEHLIDGFVVRRREIFTLFGTKII